MASLTSRLKLRKPATTDTVNVDTDLSANYDIIDLIAGYQVVTSGTRPSTPYVGQTIFETDTNKNYMWNGTIWLPQYSDYNPPASAYTLRNALHNGDMRVAQRGTTGAGPVGVSTIASRTGLDRWACLRVGAVAGVTWTQTTKNLLSQRNGLRIQRDSANASTAVCQTYQQIESVDAVRFQGKFVTISFTGKCGANYSPASSLLSVNLRTGTGTDENIQAAPFTGVADPVLQSVTLTATDQRFTFTSGAALGTTITEMALYFNMTPVGTAGANDWFEITEIQVEEGTVATPFEHRPYQLELATCQRYFQRISQPAAGNLICGFGLVPAANTVNVVMPLPVEMRTTPIAVSASFTAQFITTAAGNQSITGGGYTATGSNAKLVYLAFTTSGAGLTVGGCAGLAGIGTSSIIDIFADL